MNVILTTPRLYLRHFEPGDEMLLYQLNADIEVVQYTGNPPMKDLNEANDVLMNLIIPQYFIGLGRWAVHIKDTNEFIGWCGLKKTDDGIDLGYRFFKHTWGNGYGGESAKAVLKYAFKQLHIEKIIAHAVVQNINSIKILDRIGMQRTQVVDQGYRSIQCFELSYEDFVKQE